MPLAIQTMESLASTLPSAPGADTRAAPGAHASAADHVALLTADGMVIAASGAWSAFASRHGFAASPDGIGVEYCAVCARASGFAVDQLLAAHAQVQRVLDGTLDHFDFEYACTTAAAGQWYRVVVRSVSGMHPVVATATHTAVVPEHEVERVNEALRRSEERLRHQFARLPILTNLWKTHGDDFILVDANDLARRDFATHLSSAIGKTSTEIFPLLPQLNADRRQCLRENRVITRTVAFDRGRGPRILEVTLGPQQPDHVLAHAVDITDRIDLELQLREAEKLKAVGQLAGGIAHDYNNLLTVIISAAQMVKMGMPAAHEDRAAVEEIEGAAARAAQLTSQLQLFGRRQSAPLSPIDANVALREVQPLLRHLVGPGVVLELALGDVPFDVDLELGQLGQVMMNLVTNANEAMADGGTIRIETAVRELDDALRAAHADALPGPYLRIRVTDTGEGMHAHVLPRIFEPFFTTRARGKGAGLGLSTVHGFVRQWGGFIQATSVVRGGSAFAIFLPALSAICVTRAAGAPEGTGAPEPAQPSPLAPAQAGTILLVDDDDGLRAVTRMVLTRAGYRVLESANGIDALRLLEGMDEPVDVVLSDLIMPGMGGRDLGYEIRIRYPEAVVVLMSGYAQDAVHVADPLHVDTVFLTKPFTPAALQHAVARALAARDVIAVPEMADVPDTDHPAVDRRALDVLVNGIDAVVWEADAATGRILYVNRRAESLLGYPRERWHAEGFMNAITHVDDRERVQELRRRCARAREGYTAEYRATAASGEILWVRDVVGAIHRKPGARAQLGGVLFDISETKRTMDELRMAKEGAERADGAKSQFLALVSHELHTPLNAVIGFANVLQRNRAGNLTAHDVSYVERISANGRQLLRIVSDMLDLTQLEAGALAMHLTPVALDVAIADVARDFEGAAAQKGLTFCTSTPSGLCPITADRSRLTQVLSSLIENAIKYCATGSVTLRVVTHSDGVTPVRIEVEDTGAGIADCVQESMFSPFRQEEHFTRRRHGGAGMGLSIARGLCDLMGFRLTLASTIDVGSVFAIHLVSA